MTAIPPRRWGLLFICTIGWLGSQGCEIADRSADDTSRDATLPLDVPPDATLSKDASSDVDGSLPLDATLADSSTPPLDAGTDSGSVDAFIPEDAGEPDPDASTACDAPSDTLLAEDLACTGLYTDVATKQLSSQVRRFKPAFELWSDGAQQSRWISLPAGETIDTTDPDSWRFPVGTRVFKELTVDGHRAETRVMRKVTARHWLKASYRWSEDESTATRFGGGPIQVAGKPYYVPSGTECDKCHKGGSDRLLGFEGILLGHDGAAGLTLAKLAQEGRLSSALPASYEIGDDGTGLGQPALGWLHVNCGVSCHNARHAALAYSTGFYMRIKASEADGSSSAGVDTRTTGIGLNADTSRWSEEIRITAGSPENSLLHRLIDNRDDPMSKEQMPPIVSHKIDTAARDQVAAWIVGMANP